MKRLISILISVVLSFSLASCTNRNEEADDYSGEKLSYTEMIDGDGIVLKRWYYKYYPDGEISTSTRCLEDGTCVQRNEYTYNDDKLKNCETIYIYGKKASVTEFTYTDDGKIKTEKVYLPDSITESVYYYNSDGTENRVETLDAEGQLIKTKLCIYDEAGDKKKERFFNANNTYTGGIEYTYENHVLIMKEYVRSAVGEFSKEEYTYDGENIVKTVFYDPSGKLLYTDTAEFDGERVLHRMRKAADDSIVYTWDAYYDSFLTLIG